MASLLRSKLVLQLNCGALHGIPNMVERLDLTGIDPLLKPF